MINSSLAILDDTNFNDACTLFFNEEAVDFFLYSESGIRVEMKVPELFGDESISVSNFPISTVIRMQ